MKRNKTAILMWMLQNEIKQVDIQAALKMKGKTMVCETIKGQRNNRQVLAWLLEKGCPVEYLALPDDMKEAA